METKKSIGFGFRGWLLIIVLFFGFMMFQVFTNYPLNILADFYGGAEKVAMLMTIGTGIGIVLQIVISNFIGKIKSIKKADSGHRSGSGCGCIWSCKNSVCTADCLVRSIFD
mgnify:CR=1 FL=1